MAAFSCLALAPLICYDNDIRGFWYSLVMFIELIYHVFWPSSFAFC